MSTTTSQLEEVRRRREAIALELAKLNAAKAERELPQHAGPAIQQDETATASAPTRSRAAWFVGGLLVVLGVGAAVYWRRKR